MNLERIRKIRNYCVPMDEDIMKELKRKAHVKTHKDAIVKAIVHYLECPNTENGSNDDNVST